MCWINTSSLLLCMPSGKAEQGYRQMLSKLKQRFDEGVRISMFAVPCWAIFLMLVRYFLQAFSEEDRGRAPLNNACGTLQDVLPRRSSISLPGRGGNKDFHLEFISRQQLVFTLQTQHIAFIKNHVQKCWRGEGSLLLLNFYRCADIHMNTSHIARLAVACSKHQLVLQWCHFYTY